MLRPCIHNLKLILDKAYKLHFINLKHARAHTQGKRNSCSVLLTRCSDENCYAYSVFLNNNNKMLCKPLLSVIIALDSTFGSKKVTYCDSFESH